MKRRMSICALVAALACLNACSAKIEATDGGGGAGGVVDTSPASKISSQPLAGVISEHEWKAGSGIARVVTYSDGAQMLKVEIGAQTFAGCNQPTDFGWTGGVTFFVPINIGLMLGDSATVEFVLAEAQGEVYVRKNKAVRIDTITTNIVKGALYAETEGHEVSGTFKATLCP